MSRAPMRFYEPERPAVVNLERQAVGGKSPRLGQGNKVFARQGFGGSIAIYPDLRPTK